MADNVTLPGAGAVIRSDDLGSGVQAQIVKLMIGADGVGNFLSVGAGAVDTGVPRMTLASDDPAVAGIGGTADAAASAGGTGSLNAKLRLATTQLDNITTRLGEVQASPTANTVLDRLKALLTGIVLAASTNAIGKLAANSGVDIGDVDVTSIAAGTNLVGDVGIQPRATNGLSTMNASSSDGATALTSSAQAIKGSAGKLFGWYIYNPNSVAVFVQLYNTASGSVTVGTTAPLFMMTIPALSAANLLNDIGITFSTAISWAATSTAGGNGAPTTALDAVAFYA